LDPKPLSTWLTREFSFFVSAEVTPKAKMAAKKEHDEISEKRWAIVQDMLEGLE
jgi:hypothetical protein